jgi:hypothetical protein
MHPASVDVENEMEEIAQEVGRLSLRLGQIGTERLEAGSQGEWEAVLVRVSAADEPPVSTSQEADHFREVLCRAGSIDGVPASRAEYLQD